MSKKPSIYLDNMKESKQHNKRYCLVTNKSIVEDQLDKLFQEKNPYMQKVFIQTKTHSFETRIYEKRDQAVVTIDHQIIPITEIEFIKRIS